MKCKTPAKLNVGYMARHPWICAAVVVVVIYWIVRLFVVPPILSQTSFSHAYYDRDGKLMRMTLSADDKYRLYTKLSDISPDAARAIILYEDKYFNFHPGINPISMVRAMRQYISASPHPVGASTITMQVARMRYNIDSRRPSGKLKQIALAVYIDAFHSKREIIEAYLNLAPYGGNIEGIGAASRILFQKRASDLTTIESITLATIPQNPSKRNIATPGGLDRIMHMRGDLVRRWIDAYVPKTDDATIAHLRTMAQMPLATHTTRELPFTAPHFTDFMISKSETYLGSIGPHKTEINTTLDANLQSVLQRALTREIARRRAVGIENAAAVLINYKTLETLSYIGSADYFNRDILGENDGVRARRSPGSTLKPLIYAAAVDKGFIHSMTLLKDARVNFGVYAPENSDNEFYGPVLAHTALTHSRNIPAINLLRQIGLRDFYNLLQQAGVTQLKSPSHYGISVALGGAEVSMWELADIYTMMANLGRRRELRTETDTPIADAHPMLSREAFFLTLDMMAAQKTLNNNVPFTRHAAPIRHYWKTGTSSSYRDAWTAGIFGDFVLVVWVGNFDGRPNNAFSGARAAAPIYFALSDAVRDYYASIGQPIQNNNFLETDMNISHIDMCDDVGGIAGAHCPRVRPAYFIPGTSPIDTSSVYRAVPIDNKTGLRACTYDAATTHMAVFEFWDAEYLDMFRRAGVRRNTPPAYMPGCDLDTIAATRSALIITSPADATRIVITDGRDTTNVSFHAATDMNDVKIFWFLDDVVIGTSMPMDTITVPVSIGRHTVRAIDEMGAAASSEFMVVK